MKKLYSAFVALFFLLAFHSCKKPAGEGGNSSIRGKLITEEWNKTFTVKNFEYPGADEYVYIIYGDDISYGDRIKTSYDGAFEFKYLRPGKYKVYAYSQQYQTSSNQSPFTPVLKEVEIKRKKEVLDIGTMTIKRD